jgi:hypothetical protein
MKRILGGFGVAALMLAAAGCHPITEEEIVGWSGSVFDWQNRTYQTICEIARFIDPTPGDNDYTGIGNETNIYCGPSGGGLPNPPPNWGA